MLLTQLLVPTYTQMLRGLAAWLDKASTQETAAGGDDEALLSARLAPDMFPLAAQVRFACFQAQEAVHRLKGEPVPEALLEVRREGWNAAEQPGTIAQAKARVAEALDLLSAQGADTLEGGADLPMTIELPNGMKFDMTGSEFARDWSLPQFYFHLNAAYAILRSHGIELGKADYVSHMFAYLRPDTAPQA
ncbi:DUF1993 family protein [Novosphingobium aerophilum]|uniref:DUF1993 domain-containing protein n=1 Tax=Novosphingobium aerophilum TaxID=2839843 RepID=UPI003FD0ABB5